VPIYDLGYRGWQGRLVPEAGRFWAITTTGIRLAWQSRLLRRILAMASIPIVYTGILFFVFEQASGYAKAMGGTPARFAQSGRGGGPIGTLQEMIPPVIPKSWYERLAGLDRHPWWSMLFWIFFRYPQPLALAVVVGILAPPLVAQDVRTRAFMLYFSRPITRIEYILGKMATVWAYLLMITAVPALAMYALGVFMSPPDSAVLKDTWDIPLRILAASAVLVVPTAALALALSSLTSESRYAAFAWFAIWAVGWVTYAIYYGLLPKSEALPYWRLASLYHTLGEVQGYVIGLETNFATISAAAIELAVITLVSLVILFRRVSSPMRI
jgi:hypothetical protein